ncbi:MAG TPA: hypothetical protein VFD09_10525 [Thiopseudomonas sp.]|nr:hypothetical protein [Thiopseudomonas sp.]
MSEFFRFTNKKQNYDARHIKVFVHGYLSATDVYDLKYIPDLPDDEGALFAFLDSGSVKDMWVDILKSTVRSICYNAERNEQGIALGWKDIRDLNPGDTVSKTYTDITQATGPVERTIVYEAPFFKPDREQDYATAWAFFNGNR